MAGWHRWKQASPRGRVTSNALAAASEDDLKVANQRFEIVRRHLNGEPPPDGASVPERTLRLWVARYREAKAQHGSGYLGLIPQTSQRGNRGSKLPEESRSLTQPVHRAELRNVQSRSRSLSHGLHCCMRVRKKESRHRATPHSVRRHGGVQYLRAR